MEESSTLSGRKPSLVSLPKLGDDRRQAVGFAAAGTIAAVNVASKEVNPIVVAALVAVLGALSWRYQPAAKFMVSGLGGLVYDGAIQISRHLSNISLRTGVDLVCAGLVLLAFDWNADFLPLVSAAWAVTSLIAISMMNKTIDDQYVLDATDAEIEAMLDDNSEVAYYREKLGKSVESQLYCTRILQKLPTLKEYCWSDVETHNKKDDLWVVAHGLVYNLTDFYVNHPGGRKVLLTMGGRDCTDALEEYHPDNVFQTLPKYLIGKLPDSERSSVTSESTTSDEVKEDPMVATNEGMLNDYHRVRQILLDMKLFETDMDYYYSKFLFNFMQWALAVYLAVFTSSVVLHCISAFLVAIVWQQMAFVGHDLGHNAMTHKRSIDYLLGAIVGNLLGGISIGWWKFSHNVHHINCNSIHDDPDIQHMPVFAVSKTMLGSFFSTFHQKVFVFDIASKILLSFQHILFYPIMAFARVNLYIQSLLFFIHNPLYLDNALNYDAEYKNVELTSWMGFFLWYGGVIVALPSWEERILYFLISHAVSGILHVQICISHFTMKAYTGKFTNHVAEEVSKCAGGEEDALIHENSENWLLLQLNTSMNVDTPEYMDFFHGGLQYQIEHHLFPRLPRHNLRIAQRFIKKICEKHNIEYRNLSFLDANIELVNHLKENAMNARKQCVDSRDFRCSEMYEAMNLIG